jgi:hypothetical protein
MPQTIYLPQKQQWWDPMFKQGSNFLWQLAMSKAQHKMKMEESDRLLALEKIEAEKERAREQAKLKEGRTYTEGREKEKRTYEERKLKEKREYEQKHPKPSTDVKNYKFAKQQFILGKGPNPGSFVDYQKRVQEAKATKITFDEKVGLHKAKAQITHDVVTKGKVVSPELRIKVTENLQKQFKDTWEFMHPIIREEKIFGEMDRIVKDAFPNRDIVYDPSRQGWVDSKGNLVKKHKIEIYHRRDMRR